MTTMREVCTDDISNLAHALAVVDYLGYLDHEEVMTHIHIKTNGTTFKFSISEAEAVYRELRDIFSYRDSDILIEDRPSPIFKTASDKSMFPCFDPEPSDGMSLHTPESYRNEVTNSD